MYYLLSNKTDFNATFVGKQLDFDLTFYLTLQHTNNVYSVLRTICVKSEESELAFDFLSNKAGGKYPLFY